MINDANEIVAVKTILHDFMICGLVTHRGTAMRGEILENFDTLEGILENS